MPLVIPSDLPAKSILEKEQIFTMTTQRAETQDIRPLKLAILNLMPKKEETETQLLRMLSNTALQVHVDLIRTDSHESKNTDYTHLHRFYKTFDEIKQNKYDAMIITRSEEHTSELQSRQYLVCRLLLEKKKRAWSTPCLPLHSGPTARGLPRAAFCASRTRSGRALFGRTGSAIWTRCRRCLYRRA